MLGGDEVEALQRSESSQMFNGVFTRGPLGVQQRGTPYFLGGTEASASFSLAVSLTPDKASRILLLL